MSVVTLDTGGATLRADLSRPHDLSIPLRFDGDQPSAFGAARAAGAPLRAGTFIGDVNQGGSCNCEEYHLAPHCNGTHTECVGHVTRQRISVRDVLTGGLEPALLLSVTTLDADGCAEDSDPAPGQGDRLITAQAIEAAWKQHQWSGVNVRALALRTLPNPADKAARHYSADAPPPYLTRQAVELVVARGIEHLLLDLPSLDRMQDEGKLTGHRLFWGLPAGGNDAASATRPRATVTELMFAPDSAPDGRYLLDLQIAPFAADAAPSRPILYPVI